MHPTTRAVALALCASTLLLLPRPTAAEPIDPKTLPQDLSAWVPWVLHGKASRVCPMVHGVQDETRCAWPSRLELRLDDKGGTFTQRWHLHTKSWVPLPGDAKRWPQGVLLDRKKVAVVKGPRVHMAAGDHTISGTFSWDSLPESLQIPPQTGLLALTVKGKAVTRPNRQKSGVVFLQRAATHDQGERLEVLVHRKVTDTVPLLLTTRVVLNVAGKSREVLLGRSLPAGFVPTALEAKLPARLEPDSRVRVQVRPGTWTLTITARSTKPVSQLKRPKPGGPWRGGEEVWVFEARSALRLVSVEGVDAVDPQQTSLPAAWKRLPAYPMRLGSTLRLVEKRRGDAEPTPDRLTLSRTLWLDFDGGGYTASDTITGALQRPGRLEMDPPTQLGRVSLGGRDQFITYLKDRGRRGVELRPGPLSLTADSRIGGARGNIPATGWSRDFHKVSGQLNLPPGWRLLHASGVDEVPGTWLRHWTLLEIFLALLLAIAVWRLYGLGWGVLALITFALIFPEDYAPKWIWVGVLALEALVRALSRPWLDRVLVISRHVVAVGLVLLAIPFLIQHVRVGLYPALELDRQMADLAGMAGVAPRSSLLPHQEVLNQQVWKQQVLSEQRQVKDQRDKSGVKHDEPLDALSEEVSKREQKVLVHTPKPSPLPQPQQVKPAEKTPQDSRQIIGNDVGIRGALSGKKKVFWRGRKSSGLYSGQRQFNAEEYDPKAMVQTGPGRPRWQWKHFTLAWSGPVQRDQRLRLMLLSPAVNLLLALLRAALLVLLVFRLVPWKLPRLPLTRGGRGGGGAALARGGGATLALLLALWPATSHAEIPDSELRDELQRRLLARPACAPSCASSPRLLLELQPARLTARMEIVAAAAAAVPLPGGAAQWSPQRVLIDGKPARGLARDAAGKLWLLVEPGVHQVILDGPLPDQESVQLSLPLRPHQVQAKAAGWTVSGLHEDGLADDNLQLTRIRAAGKGAVLRPGTLPPFVRVERRVLIGLNWQVETRVVRLTPAGVAVVLKIPLLPGESVTTADLRVVEGKVLVNMGPQVTQLSWRSVLRERSPLLLAAPRGPGWTELWQLEVSPIWHAAVSGLPAVHPQGRVVPRWRPWPGEKLRVDLTRPAGVSGKTFTVDQSWLKVGPGLRTSDTELRLVVRSSRGAQHTITLPAGATVEAVKINDKPQPFRQVGRKVTLTLVPGAQEIRLTWRDPHGVGLVYRVKPADLGTPSVNASTDLSFSNARWILFCGGPRLGPVVRFWSLLLVLLLVALVLSRVRWVPLRWWHWMLLAIGLSQIHLVLAALLVGWLILLGWRGQSSAEETERRIWFNMRQIVIMVATLVAVVVLVLAVHEGLLGRPDMQISGNSSTTDQLRWFSDRAAATPAAPWVLSAPLLVYRLAMLAWALWLAFAVLRWLKWGWGTFSRGGFWALAPAVATPSTTAPAGAAAAGAAAPAEPAPAAPASVEPEGAAPGESADPSAPDGDSDDSS